MTVCQNTTIVGSRCSVERHPDRSYRFYGCCITARRLDDRASRPLMLSIVVDEFRHVPVEADRQQPQ